MIKLSAVSLHFERKKEEGTPSAAYTEMIRRIQPNELSAIEDQMKKLSVTPHFLQAVEEGDVLSISKIYNYPLLALLALKEEKITSDAFATICIYYSMAEHGPADILPLFMDGQINDELQGMIAFTMRIPTTSDFFSIVSCKTHFCSPMLKSFFEEMKKLPRLQQLIFRADDRWLSSPNQQTTIGTALLDLKGFNVFGRTQQGQRLFGAFGVMQTFLKIRSTNDCPLQINPVLGSSSTEDLAKGELKRVRDMGIPFPGVQLPEYIEADEYYAPGLQFTHHDLYHLMVVNEVPQPHRDLFIKIASIVKEFIPRAFYQETQGLENLRESLIDMECANYMTNSLLQEKFDLNYLFFLELKELLQSNLEQFQLSHTTQRDLLEAIAENLPLDPKILQYPGRIKPLRVDLKNPVPPFSYGSNVIANIFRQRLRQSQ